MSDQEKLEDLRRKFCLLVYALIEAGIDIPDELAKEVEEGAALSK